MTGHYKDPRILSRRISAYSAYSENRIDFHDWVMEKVPCGSYDVIIDAGAGSGLFLSKIVERTRPRVALATDIEMNMISEARRISYAAPVNFFQSDIQQLPVPDRSVDLIFASHIINYTDVRKALKELRRVLKDDGYLVSTANSRYSMLEFQKLHGKVIGAGTPVRRNHAFTTESGNIYLSEVFESTESYMFTNTINFPSEESFLDFYSMLWIYMNLDGDLDMNLDNDELHRRQESAREIVMSGEICRKVRKTSGVFISRGYGT